MDLKRRDLYEQKIEREPTTGCWLWTAGQNGKGYGIFGVVSATVWHIRTGRSWGWLDAPA